MSRVSLEFTGGYEKRFSYGRKDEEYVADFILVTRRTLDEEEFRLFRFHYLLGADWRLCCRRLNLDRGTFFHIVYRIQQKLGKTFRELEPYSLFPLEVYFSKTTQNTEPLRARQDVISMERPGGGRRIVPPIRKAA
ncbi:MAG: hypothetical protein ACK5AZ_01950 [Bryobacteraceae bacterium]